MVERGYLNIFCIREWDHKQFVQFQPNFKRLFCEAAFINEWTESEQKYNLLNNLHGEADRSMSPLKNSFHIYW